MEDSDRRAARARPIKKVTFVAAVVAFSTLLGTETESLAQTWPERTVKLIVPLGPASGADVTARLLADHLSKRWGKAVVVENRPGADGIVGISAFLAGPPDDHVLLFAPTGTFTAHPFLHEKLSYNPEGLIPIARVTNTLVGVSVPTALNVKIPCRIHEAGSVAARALSLGERHRCDRSVVLRLSQPRWREHGQDPLSR
jgi:hypothetical protein